MEERIDFLVKAVHVMKDDLEDIKSGLKWTSPTYMDANVSLHEFIFSRKKEQGDEKTLKVCERYKALYPAFDVVDKLRDPNIGPMSAAVRRLGAAYPHFSIDLINNAITEIEVYMLSVNERDKEKSSVWKMLGF